MREKRAGRRQVLSGLSVIGISGLAGCSSGESTTDDSSATESGDESEESTADDDSSEDANQHEIGESFTVGSGTQSIAYVVEQASLAELIGTSSFNTEPDGLFLVLIVTMENVGDETIDITSRHLKVVDNEGRRFDADTEANTYIGQDSRFDAEGIVFEQLQPGLQQTRAIAFDVATNRSYAFQVDPAGLVSGAESHYVALGNVPEP